MVMHEAADRAQHVAVIIRMGEAHGEHKYRAVSTAHQFVQALSDRRVCSLQSRRRVEGHSHSGACRVHASLAQADSHRGGISRRHLERVVNRFLQEGSAHTQSAQ